MDHSSLLWLAQFPVNTRARRAMQDLPRIHIGEDEAVLAEAAEVPLPPGQAHYLGHVLRRAPGAGVRLFNARDGEWDGEIETLRKERGSVRLTRQVRAPAPEPGPVLVFAPLKRDATDLVVRMATELGASALLPVLTERSNTQRINAERWHAIAAEAAEQCERLSLPRIAPPRRLADLLGDWPAENPLLAAIERADGGERQSIAHWRAAAGGALATLQPGLAIGPEGGFAPAELALFRSRPFVVPVSLGPRILRAETAAAAGLAALGS